MSNQGPPIVAPDEYERNRAIFAQYRQYLEMYERMNEQGLRNHEQIEQALEQQIRAGEEARQHLEMLRKSATQVMRLTDGHPVRSDQVIIPTMQAPPPAAYIEEVPSHDQKTSSGSSYVPQSAPSHTSTPQPSYYSQQQQSQQQQSQQQQTNYNTTSYPGPQYDRQTQRNVPTPPQPPQPSVQTGPSSAQHPHTRTYQTNAQPSQQSYPPIAPRMVYQQQHNVQTPGTTPTPAQLEQHRLLQQHNDQMRQARGNTRHHPSTHYSNPPNQQAHPNQTQGQANGQQQSYRQSQSVPQPNSGYQVQQSTSRASEIQQQTHTAVNATTTLITPTPQAVINQARPSSSLEGALGVTSSGNVRTPSTTAPQSYSKPPAPSNVSAINAPPSTPMGNIQASAPPNGVPQQTPSIPATQPTPDSSGARIPNPVTSPARTPSQADKKSLARDLLRALKRPRPDTSSASVKEPEPKRHATEAVVKPIAQTAKAIPSTSMPSVRPAVLPVTVAPLPTKPTAQISPTVTVPSIPVTSPATVQPSAVSVKPASTPATAQVTPLQTVPPAAPTTSTSTVTQNVPNPPVTARQTPNTSLSALVRAQIKQATSFGIPVTLSPRHHDGADTNVGASTSKFQAVTAIKQYAIPDTSVSRLSKAPQTTEPVKVSVAPNTGTTQPEPEKVLVAQLPTPVAPAPVAGPSHVPTPSAAATAAASGSQTIVVVPETSVVDNIVGPSTKVSGAMAFPPPAKVPLFLPSPTSSPTIPSANGSIPKVSLEVLPKEEKGKERAMSPTVSQLPVSSPTKKLRPMVMAYVLAPPLPEYVRKWKEAQHRKVVQDELDTINHGAGVLSLASKSRSPSLGDFGGRSGSRSPSVPVVFIKAIEGHEESDMEEPGVWDLNFVSYDEAEKEVLHEHCSRLRESFCRWWECEVVVNTPGALLRHLDVEHGPRRVNAESPWTCQWTGCGYTVISRDDYQQHIEKHAVFPVRCPYKGCNESFRTPRQLIKHKRNDHGSDAVLRPTASPLTVTKQSLAPIPPIPRILPSYMTEYRVVRPASISKQRHENIMPSILRRISGNIPAHLQRYNAARPMPMTPSKSQPEPPVKNTPYSFLEHRSTRYSSYLSTPARSRNIQDVDSSHVTNLTRKGLVLWPGRDGEAVPEAMIAELEGTEEDAVERELLEEEGYDVFGPTITTESVGGSGGGDGGGSGGGGSYVEADPGDKSL